MKPRSLILDLFGGYLRYVDAEVRLSHLTQVLGAFDVAPPTVRVTLSRLRREGWFVTRRQGRETLYSLTPGMLGVLDEGRRRIFAGPAQSWVGTWTIVIYQMSESGRQERNQLRKTLAWHGFGPLTTSTWIAPGDRRKEVRVLIDGLTDERVDVLSCSSESLEHDRELARRCWDLESLARDYVVFNHAHRHLLHGHESVPGAEALVQRTELISRYRHFPFQDPGLPRELRPDPWPGTEAHDIFCAAHDRLGDAARAYVSDIVGQTIPDPGSLTSTISARPASEGRGARERLAAVDHRRFR
jgi:phenylacetic acid degradation operon negative regulatory protein